ncbi:MAG: DUF3606 domain-containing protein [Chthoniobacterales bacterium]
MTDSSSDSDQRHEGVNLDDSSEVEFWVSKLQFSEDEIRRAVEKVGTSPQKVEEFLNAPAC